jgi:hypothetical protein
MRWHRPPSGFAPLVKVTRWKTPAAARCRKREYARRQRARDQIRYYNIPLPARVIERLYARLHTDVLDKKTLLAELAAVLTETLEK